MKRIGRIIAIDTFKGGGIIRDENEQDIRFYRSNATNALAISDEVVFEIELADKGLSAVNLKLIPARKLDCTVEQ